MEKLYNKGTFLFNYNSIADRKPNLGHDIKQFWLRQNVVAKFSTHAINFKSMHKPDGRFNYNFRLWSIYLVRGDSIISTSKKRKQDLDEWVVFSSRTRKTNV